MDVLGQIDLRYWQLTSSEPMPDEFDVAVIEGAVTTEEAARPGAAPASARRSVIAIGACATTGRHPRHGLRAFWRVPWRCTAMRCPRPAAR